MSWWVSTTRPETILGDVVVAGTQTTPATRTPTGAASHPFSGELLPVVLTLTRTGAGHGR